MKTCFIYSPDLVQWFAGMDMPNLTIDTIANEITFEPVTGDLRPHHCALMQHSGITLVEMLLLDKLDENSATDGQSAFLYTAGRLKVPHGSRAPANLSPVA